jgi:hypothetical protein
MKIYIRTFYYLMKVIARINRIPNLRLPAFSALIFFTLILTIDVLLISSIVFGGLPIKSNATIYVIFGLIGFIHYFIFIYKKQYEKLHIKFANDTKRDKIFSLLFIITLILSILILSIIDFNIRKAS